MAWWLCGGLAGAVAWLWRENRRLRGREHAAWMERLHYRRLLREVEDAVQAASQLIAEKEAKHGPTPWAGN